MRRRLGPVAASSNDVKMAAWAAAALRPVFAYAMARYRWGPATPRGRASPEVSDPPCSRSSQLIVRHAERRDDETYPGAFVVESRTWTSLNRPEPRTRISSSSGREHIASSAAECPSRYDVRTLSDRHAFFSPRLWIPTILRDPHLQGADLDAATRRASFCIRTLLRDFPQLHTMPKDRGPEKGADPVPRPAAPTSPPERQPRIDAAGQACCSAASADPTDPHSSTRRGDHDGGVRAGRARGEKPLHPLAHPPSGRKALRHRGTPSARGMDADDAEALLAG